MSDLGFSVSGQGFSLVEALSRPRGFTPDRRFGGELPASEPEPEPEPEPAETEPEAPDPLAEAYTEGFAAGYEQARAEAEAKAAEDAAAFEGLKLAFARLDSTLEAELRLRLRDTVSALCEAAIAPLAIDEDALMRRVTCAVSMLARADDERVIRIHPEDLQLISKRLSDEWQVQPDATLERGTIRIESENGGVEDGPATWRLAIAEAMHQC
ncbi:FliH/SctL family protein [Novosphingobium malaysiense]|uniref:Flagellar assembly protein FliH n=1 Tax=Novosphingobium malaysiense TaxID=1348853 RepID=A0A0B1ZS94_9SPHN|nr:FliH/SctL family protein [Novosphingobium malaysiense]KHK93491.1 flagellar biosynthesis protein [Novosphingobium malaysiense]